MLWGILSTLFFVTLFTFKPTLFQPLDLINYDLLLRNFPYNHASSRVVIVDIDKKSLSQFGQWPWPRYLVADLLDKVAELKPEIIGLDMVFAEPDRTSAGRLLKDLENYYGFTVTVNQLPDELSDNDQILAETLAQGPCVLVNHFVFNTLHNSQEECLLHPVKVSLLQDTEGQDVGLGIPKSRGVLCNLKILSEKVDASGFSNFSPDQDGMLRSLPQLIQYNGEVYASLALATVMKAMGVNNLLLKKEGNTLKSINFKEISIPVDSHGRLLVKFRGPKYKYHYVSAADIMNGTVSAEQIKGRIAFVGTSAVGLRESLTTPFDSTFWGIEVHATVADNLLTGDFISIPSWSHGLALLLVFIPGVLLALLFFRFKNTTFHFIVVVLFVAGLWLATQQLFFRTGLFVGTTFPMVSIVCNYIFLAFLKYRSDNKRVEAALKESEKRFRTLFLNTPLPISHISIDGKILDVNDSFTETIGYTFDDIPSLGHAWNLFFNDDELKNRIISKWSTNLACAVADNSEMESFEVPILCKDGTLKTMAIGGRLLGGSVIVSFFDITERKRSEKASQESEKKLRSIFAAMTDVILIFDAEGRCLEIAPTNTELLYRPRDELLGKGIRDIFPPEKANEFLSAIKSVITQNKSVPLDYDLMLGSRQVWFASSLSPLPSDRVILVARDITERKQAEVERENLQEQLHQSRKLEAIGTLAGGVAHDFNNMLGAIMGYAELAKIKMNPADPSHKNLDHILDAAQRSVKLTRQLLAFARKQNIEPVVFDLNESIERILKMIRRLIGENSELRWLPGSGPCRIKMDPSQLDQILVNLCVNARDSITDVGVITIETETAYFDEAYCELHIGVNPGGYALLSVKDNGCGMDRETLDHAFEPFFTTKGAGQGTGMGLATVYGIVQQNEGFINVDSKPGKGTTFAIYIPLSGVEKKAVISDGLKDYPRSRGENILLVEDDPTLLKMAVKMLQGMGYSVKSADTPGEAIRIAKEDDFEIHLVITDVIMPGMNGRELAEKLKKIKSKIRTLYMSGYTSDIISQQGVLEEGVQFLQKPFSWNDLAFKVREALD